MALKLLLNRQVLKVILKVILAVVLFFSVVIFGLSTSSKYRRFELSHEKTNVITINNFIADVDSEETKSQKSDEASLNPSLSIFNGQSTASAIAPKQLSSDISFYTFNPKKFPKLPVEFENFYYNLNISKENIEKLIVEAGPNGMINQLGLSGYFAEVLFKLQQRNINILPLIAQVYQESAVGTAFNPVTISQEDYTRINGVGKGIPEPNENRSRVSSTITTYEAILKQPFVSTGNGYTAYAINFWGYGQHSGADKTAHLFGFITGKKEIDSANVKNALKIFYLGYNNGESLVFDNFYNKRIGKTSRTYLHYANSNGQRYTDGNKALLWVSNEPGANFEGVNDWSSSIINVMANYNANTWYPIELQLICNDYRDKIGLPRLKEVENK